jgi:WD40 repeat protein/serine/threonine protein kinase
MDPGTFISTDLPRHIVESRLPGSGRMFRGFRIRSNEGVLFICKATVLKFEPEATATEGGDSTKQILKGEITRQAAELSRILKAVGNPETHPHVLPYQRWIVSENARRDRPGFTYQPIYLLRQHCFTTLADRLATRPFLTNVEKIWIAFQILKALQSIHDAGVCHGYLTTENICLTSWNWVVLTDFASFKPTMIPEDDPSDFIYYFQEQDDASGGQSTKRCSLAPERFYKRQKQHDASITEGASVSSGDDHEHYEEMQHQKPLTPEMDIFSAGCVIAETMLNGEGILELGDVMEYRRNGGVSEVLTQKLNKIESSAVRAACKHMLSLSPADRLSASTYLARLSYDPSTDSAPTDNSQSIAKKAANTKPPQIPRSFEQFLWPTLCRLRQDILSPDARIALVASTMKEAMTALTGSHEGDGSQDEESYFELIVGEAALRILNDKQSTNVKVKTTEEGVNVNVDDHIAQLGTETWHQGLVGETEALLQRIEELDLEAGLHGLSATNPPSIKTSEKDLATPSDNDVARTEFPKSPMEEKGRKGFKADSTPRGSNASHSEASIVFLQLVLSSIRHVQRPSSKIVALQMLLQLSKCSSDDIRLGRIVPSLVALLEDPNTAVRATSIRVLARVLEVVKVFNPSDAMLFPQFIFKKVAHLVHDDQMIVRVAFAESVAILAEAAQRFLEVTQAKRLYETVAAGVSPSDKYHPAGPTSAFTDDVANLLVRNTSEAQSNQAETRSKSRNAVPLSENEVGQGFSTVLAPNTYDNDLAAVQDTVAGWIMQIATDSSDYSSPPKCALLSSLGRLSSVFGHDGVTTQILPQVLAFLNDRTDWQVRAALCENLPAACAVVGRVATEHFVVPCIETALMDGNDRVIYAALLCLSSLVKMSLLTRALVFGKSSDTFGDDMKATNAPTGVTGLLRKYAPLLLHPSREVRHGALVFVTSVSQSVGFPDGKVFVLPRIAPFLQYEPDHDQLCSTRRLSQSLLDPVSRQGFNNELERFWSERAPGGAGDGTDDMWTSIEDENHETAINVGTQNEALSVREAMSPSNQRADAGSSHMQPIAFGTADSVTNIEQIMTTDETSRLKRMEHYLKSACNHRHTNNFFQGAVRPTSSDEVDAMEIPNMSAAYSFMIPSQKFVEFTSDTLPEWYEGLKDLSTRDQSYNPPTSCFRSLSSVSHVFGLGMTYPSNLAQTTRKWKGDAPFTSLDDVMDVSTLSGMDDGPKKVEKQKELLTSVESQLMTGSIEGEWGAMAKSDPSLLDVNLVVDKLQSLEFPCLPPRLGLLREADGLPFSWHGSAEASAKDGTASGTQAAHRSEWRPKVDSLVASSSNKKEHTAAVTRLAVSQDQAYFVSASHDGTCKVWELRQLNDAPADLSSSLTYAGHADLSSNASTSTHVKVNDVCVIENSHSVASAGSDGTVQVWRVDVASSKTPPVDGSVGTAASSRLYYDNSRVVGKSLIRRIDVSAEGQVLSVSHFNSALSSIVTFATAKGGIHTWDLRCGKEPFVLQLRPELGYICSTSMGADRNWMLAGTSRGCLTLFDIRYQMPVKTWQHNSHSAITRLATCSTTLPQDRDQKQHPSGNEPRPYTFMGCGRNEVCVFDLYSGTCRQTFRVLDSEQAYLDFGQLPHDTLAPPTFEEISLPRNCRVPISESSNRFNGSITLGRDRVQPRILSLIGRLGPAGNQYMITGGSDRCIRYWDFESPSKCYTISGLSRGQPRAMYEKTGSENGYQVFLCRQQPMPGMKDIENKKVSGMLQRGAVKSEQCHQDAILDLRMVEFPQRCLLSSAQDGVIKIWR